MPVGAKEFALHKAVTKFASEAGASRSLNRNSSGEIQWQINKLTFAQFDIDALKPMIEAYDKDLNNTDITFAIQQSAPFAFSIAYNDTDAPILINSQQYDNILMIAGQELTINQAVYLAQTIVAVLWSQDETKFSGEIYIIDRSPMFAATHNDFNAPTPNINNDNLLRLKFYSETYQNNGNYLHGGNIIKAASLVVPEIAMNGSPAEIETAKTFLGEMLAATPSPGTVTSKPWADELRENANALINLMQLLTAGIEASQLQSTPNTFIINGTIDPELWDVGYHIFNSGNTLTVNTTSGDIIGANGRSFNYRTELSDVTIGRLQAIMKDGTVCSAWMEFPFVPGESVNVTVHNGSFTLTGSDFYTQYSSVNKSASANTIFKYALDHIYDPGAVTAAFMSKKLSRDQLIELYNLISSDCRSSAIGTFLRRFF